MAQRIIDLSLKIEDNMPSHKLFQKPVYAIHTSHEQAKEKKLGVEGDLFTYATYYLSTLDHIGTHADALYHFSEFGLGIDEMPLDMFYGKAVCLDLTHIPDLGLIDVEDLEEAEKKADVRIDGHIVLLNTGLHRRYYPQPEVCLSNPGLTAEATHWLADRGSRMHGVEGPSTDVPNSSEFPSHRVCRDRGISHYEWLVNLEELVGKGEFQFYGVPLNLKKGSGSPVRAFAIVEE